MSEMRECEVGKERTRYVDIAIVGAPMVLGYAAIAQRVQLVFEFPKCVALEIEACGC
jgi:hypothetical protein